MLVWLTLPFYDFCGFRSIAVNSVYKLQFFYIYLLIPYLLYICLAYLFIYRVVSVDCGYLLFSKTITHHVSISFHDYIVSGTCRVHVSFMLMHYI